MEQTDSMKYFENTILTISSEYIDKCEGFDGWCPYPDLCELSFAMLLLEEKYTNEFCKEFELLENRYIAVVKTDVFGLGFCNKFVHKMDDEKEISYIDCKQKIEKVSLQRAKVYPINYFVAVLLTINEQCIDKKEKGKRNFEQMWSNIALLNPISFVIININLLFGFLTSANMSGALQLETQFCRYFTILEKITSAMEDQKVLNARNKYIQKYRKLFPESTNNIVEINKKIMTSFTALNQIAAASEVDQQAYLRHLLFVIRTIQRFEDLYSSQISSQYSLILRKYKKTLESVIKQHENNSGFFSDRLESRWENGFSETDSVTGLINLVKKYCKEKDLFIALGND